MKAGAPLKFLQSVVQGWPSRPQTQRSHADVYDRLGKEYTQHIYQGDGPEYTLLWAARYGHVQVLNRLLGDDSGDVRTRLNATELLVMGFGMCVCVCVSVVGCVHVRVRRMTGKGGKISVFGFGIMCACYVGVLSLFLSVCYVLVVFGGYLIDTHLWYT